MRKLWRSFLEMSTGEAFTGVGFGMFLSFVISYVILDQDDVNKYFWRIFALDSVIVILCMGVIAWARIQPNPDIDNRPESKREP